MVTPKIERKAEARNYGKFVIGPLERGYGVTLGNALRRVLLSSLEGAAVTSIRIADVQHEFSDIPGVREDVIRVMLQIKQLRLKLHDVDSGRMHLEVRGGGSVTAADIIAPPEIEIVNPDLYLFSVDDHNANLEIEMTVERGRGYSPADDRIGRLPIGELPVDAIYSPVKRVNWEVGYARVGQSTNFDSLMIEIWNDGAIGPEDALSTSAKILIENLDLSVRVFNSLKRTGITTVGEVIELLEKGDEAVMSIRNFGEKSLDELRQRMREKGYLKDENEIEVE